MARMLTLDPAPCADLGNGYTFLVPEAGRYGDGLRTTVHIHNGTLQHVDTVALASAPRRDAFAQQVVERTGLDPALVGQKLLELLSGVEGCVRECEARANQRSAQEGKQDSGGLFLQDPEPWDDPVDGADLIATLRGVIERFVVLPPGAAYTVALWVLHTYALDAAFTSPILYIRSPEKRCGKSTLMTLLVTLCLRALPASNISAASVYRAVEKWQPTLIIDEADTFLRHNEELAGIINAGHTRPLAYVIRTHPDTHEPERFSTWAPKAIAGIGRQRDTLEDRSIQISMRRKTKEEKVERLRLDQTGQFDEIKRMCVRWAMDHLDAIRNADPDVPDFLDDRAADNWRTLCAIAEVAAGDCLQQADDAIRKLYGESGQASDDPSSGVMLLQDLQEAFESRPHGRITSKNLITILKDIEDRPWSEWGKQGQPITKNQVAALLKPFGIRTTDVRDKNDRGKGFKIEECQDAFHRYLSSKDLEKPDPPPISNVTPGQPSNDAGISEFQTVTQESDVTDEKTWKPTSLKECRGVAFQKGGIGGKRNSEPKFDDADEVASDPHEEVF